MDLDPVDSCRIQRFFKIFLDSFSDLLDRDIGVGDLEYIISTHGYLDLFLNNPE